MHKKYYKLNPGNPYPPGVKPYVGGVNFSIFSRYASSVELLLFESSESEQPFQIIKLQQEKFDAEEHTKVIYLQKNLV